MKTSLRNDSESSRQPRMRASRAKRVMAALGIATVAAGLAHVFLNRPEAAPKAVAPRVKPSAQAEVRASLGQFEGAKRSLEERARNEPVNPVAPDVVIESVRVDKTEVCRGEQVIVTTEARADDEPARFLNFGVLGEPDLVGPRVVLTLDHPLAEGDKLVYARAKSGTMAVAKVPAVGVKDCEEPVTVAVGYARKSQLPDRAWLSAELLGPEGEEEQSFEPVSYSWDFGDGQTLETSSPEVEHSYEARLQDSAYSYFFVSVRAKDAQGREVAGARSLRFVNMGFDPTDSKVTVFAAIDQKPNAGEIISLYHGDAQPVSFHRATIRDEITSAEGEVVTTAPKEHDPATLLGFTELAPGESRKLGSLAALLPSEPGVFRVVRVEGERADGTPAVAEFDLVAATTPPAGDPTQQL
jgi:hypothetical protein